jgi:prepilin-type processing-associated H-X9-DG protein
MTKWEFLERGPRWAAALCYVLFAVCLFELVPGSGWGLILTFYVPAGVLLFGVCIWLSARVQGVTEWRDVGGALIRFGLFTIPITLITLAPMLMRPSRQAPLPPNCHDQLSQFGLMFKMFANETDGGMYPELSAEPGKLLWANSSLGNDSPLYPEYLTDPQILCCPKLRKGTLAKWRETLDPRYFDDHSYLYLGYLVRNEAELTAFAQAYRDQMKGRPDFSEDLWILRDGKLVSIPRLYADIARDCLVGKATDPTQAIAMGSMIPVLIERPGHHEGFGGHVLFFDGHVEYIEQGEWPYTDETLAILDELNAYALIRTGLPQDP